MAAPNLGFDFEREAQGFRFVIGQPAFRLIWFAQLASQLADKFVMFSLIPAATLFPVLSGSFYHLLLITFLFSAAGQLFSPAEAAAIPTVLPKKALLTANSMALMTMVLTLVVGGALAPLISRIDLYAPYWWGVVLFAL